MQMSVRVRDLNDHITCGLCKGYLVTATLVTECLHAFCKSCIVKHVEQNKRCPTCNTLIHQSQPLNHIRIDPTLQEIVNKLIPHLQQSEINREEQFYRRAGISMQMKERKRKFSDSRNVDVAKKVNFHRDDDQLFVSLELSYKHKLKLTRQNKDGALRPLERKYIRCSHHATIGHLKKLVRRKLGLSDAFEIDITCKGQLLGADHTLQFIALTTWRHKPEPVMLEFGKGETHVQERVNDISFSRHYY
ncbi:polycomb group RING finger protein 3-like [Corticium candelabrum]|uniref:polycomb group RING finger protein 3-like n=1 Tax=Corticium candelabrum TaxID=121492 RepID=UPI002E25DBD9|nr:polycomb group RING finger protein 3-like [Corticium candelabrum]